MTDCRAWTASKSPPEIRQIAKSLPIVMLSSDAKPGDAARGVKAGLSGYAIKPVARAQLLRLICDAMAMRKVSGVAAFRKRGSQGQRSREAGPHPGCRGFAGQPPAGSGRT